MPDELRVGNLGRIEETAWHALEMDQVLKDLQVRETGVTAHEAEERQERFGPNELQEAKPTRFLAVLWEQLNNFVVLLLIGASAISALLGEWVDAAAILAIVILNTVLGGSMSSRLFQNVREKRGLAYAVFSGLSAYRDAGNITIYAGCANEAVSEVIDLCVEELRGMKRSPVQDTELRRAKDHLKGSVMLSLENTSSRMSHLARQEIYFDRQFSLDETLEGIERVTPADVQRVARELFSDGSLSATVLGQVNGLQLPRERLHLN